MAKLFATLGAIAALNAGPVTAQDVEQAAAPEEIVVVGEPEEDAVRNLVGKVTRRARVDKPIGRFQDPVCVKVVGMPEGAAAVIAERIGQNVEAVGADVAAPECQPNALVAFTNDAGGELIRLREEEPWIFDDMREHEFERIVAENDGARAWHTMMTRDRYGRPLQRVRYVIELPLGGRREFEADEIVESEASRIRTPISMELTNAVVLIDLAHVEGKTFRQLADYATFRILASSGSEGMDEGGSIPSIMTLFESGSTPPAGMTTFDIAYLTALYDLSYHAQHTALQNATLRRYRQLLQAGRLPR